MNEGSIPVNTTNLSISDLVSLTSNFENSKYISTEYDGKYYYEPKPVALTQPNNSKNIEDGGANLDVPEENHQVDNGFTINDEDVNELLTMTEEMLAVIHKHRTPHSALFNR